MGLITIFHHHLGEYVSLFPSTKQANLSNPYIRRIWVMVGGFISQDCSQVMKTSRPGCSHMPAFGGGGRSSNSQKTLPLQGGPPTSLDPVKLG